MDKRFIKTAIYSFLVVIIIKIISLLKADALEKPLWILHFIFLTMCIVSLFPGIISKKVIFDRRIDKAVSRIIGITAGVLLILYIIMLVIRFVI